MSDCPAFRPDVARSVRLFRAFRTEQAAPSAYYAGLARDTIRQLGQYLDLHGQRVVDVGGGPGFFVRELREAGALALCLDTDSGELAAMGRPGPGSAVGSALRLPIASGAVDVCFSSNVLEHVGDWRAMLAEMVRVTRPGGIVFVAFTNWLSPWGGHETSPWHYLGGDRAARRYQRRHGSPPKNRYGRSLYPVSVADALIWARSAPNAAPVDAGPTRGRSPPISQAHPARQPGASPCPLPGDPLSAPATASRPLTAANAVEHGSCRSSSAAGHG